MKKLLVIAAAVIAATSAPLASDQDTFTRWVATWSASPVPPGTTFGSPTTFENQTIRHIVRVSVGGRRVRVRLSNAFGEAPLRIGAARVARHDARAAIVPESDRALTFAGQPSITIPKGAVALSDPVGVETPTHGRLAVSLYLPTNTGPATYHEVTRQTSYISPPGDFTESIDMPVQLATVSRFFLSVVEVAAREDVRVVVALGDSITVGGQSTVDAYRTWPDVLSARLNRFGPRFSVVNQGVGCGRLLFDVCGQNGAARFDRDVLTVTGATHVIVALGLNDIGIPTILGTPEELVTAAEIIVGLRQLIERAREKGLAVFGATITPVGSSVVPGFYTPENEAKRLQVNAWIRSSRAFDGVIDFDRAVRDPAKPWQLSPLLNSGDGIHPNDDGYLALANAIDPALFR
jgi:lysophospholipase L1-like esterase